MPLHLLVLAALAQPVSVSTLLPQMTDLAELATRPSPWYGNAQASSFDRAAYAGDPFANGDAGKFLRKEGDEFVMADLKGPGAVVRIWSANPGGRIRFYFDGETKARLEAEMADLLTGKVAPFRDPFAYVAARGANLYFPLPYAKSLKVTAEGPVQGLYYHVNYRTYAPGTAVETFDLQALSRASKPISDQARRLLDPVNPSRVKDRPVQRLAPGAKLTQEVRRNSGSAVHRFEVKVPFPLVQTFREMDWTDPHQPHNVLRNLILSIRFDGEETVLAPLGDFFGTAPGPNPSRTLPFEVREDGTMICRLVMPFRKNLQIQIVNAGPVEVPLQTYVEVGPFAWNDRTYLLHAQWQAERTQSRPMYDMRFLDVRGEGRFLGSNLHIANPTPAWWGEGDEKFYVDGESRPSTFGTGTEDYYGYAWCSPELFYRPYHAQPRCDGPANRGQTQVQRWHVLDSVPYQRSFRFDLELWHWADVRVTVARTNYWYARPGSSRPLPLNRALLLPPEIESGKPVEGAIEGEGIPASATGGTVTVQGGFWELSRGEQRWWQDPKAGDRLTLRVPVAEAGEYEISGHFCHARDYGIHRLSIEGQPLGQHDFYQANGVEWRKIDLGRARLEKGEAILTVECVGNNPAADPRRMFGLDYLLLRKL
ncbi:MAG TPA: DUF2961 domain-containing protein [Fimbriimonas sp.]